MQSRVLHRAGLKQHRQKSQNNKNRQQSVEFCKTKIYDNKQNTRDKKTVERPDLKTEATNVGAP